jgi:hypothetical protein
MAKDANVIEAASDFLTQSIGPSVEPRRRLGSEFVTRAMHRSEVHGIGEFGLKLLAQFQDVIVDGASAGIVFIAPHLIQKVIARNYTVGIQYQIFENLELHCSQIYWAVGSTDLHRQKIDRDITESYKALFHRCPCEIDLLADLLQKLLPGHRQD